MLIMTREYHDLVLKINCKTIIIIFYVPSTL